MMIASTSAQLPGTIRPLDPLSQPDLSLSKPRAPLTLAHFCDMSNCLLSLNSCVFIR